MLKPLSHGILLLLAAPYLLVGTFALVLFHRKLRPALATLTPQALLHSLRRRAP